jgi:hypothetical protein
MHGEVVYRSTTFSEVRSVGRNEQRGEQGRNGKLGKVRRGERVPHRTSSGRLVDQRGPHNESPSRGLRQLKGSCWSTGSGPS